MERVRGASLGRAQPGQSPGCGSATTVYPSEPPSGPSASSVGGSGVALAEGERLLRRSGTRAGSRCSSSSGRGGSSTSATRRPLGRPSPRSSSWCRPWASVPRAAGARARGLEGRRGPRSVLRRPNAGPGDRGRLRGTGPGGTLVFRDARPLLVDYTSVGATLVRPGGGPSLGLRSHEYRPARFSSRPSASRARPASWPPGVRARGSHRPGHQRLHPRPARAGAAGRSRREPRGLARAGEGPRAPGARGLPGPQRAPDHRCGVRGRVPRRHAGQPRRSRIRPFRLKGSRRPPPGEPGRERSVQMWEQLAVARGLEPQRSAQRSVAKPIRSRLRWPAKCRCSVPATWLSVERWTKPSRRSSGEPR